MTEIILSPAPELQPAPLFTPTPKAAKRVLEFFTAQINNDHTRKAYLNATRRFAAWCDEPRHRPARRRAALPRRRLHQGAARGILAAHGEAAPGRAAHAVRLAGDGPRPRREPGPRRARPQVRRQKRQDAGADGRRGARAARQHRDRQEHGGRRTARKPKNRRSSGCAIAPSSA